MSKIKSQISDLEKHKYGCQTRNKGGINIIFKGHKEGVLMHKAAKYEVCTMNCMFKTKVQRKNMAANLRIMVTAMKFLQGFATGHRFNI